MMTLPENKKIILFDAPCNLCNRAVQFVIDRDINDIFRFASLQSEIGVSIQKKIGIPPQTIDSVVLYVPGVAYYLKSDAVIEIASNLGSIYQLTSILKIFPKKFRDSIYDHIAKNRYRWFGKNQHCELNNASTKNKFL